MIGFSSGVFRGFMGQRDDCGLPAHPHSPQHTVYLAIYIYTYIYICVCLHICMCSYLPHLGYAYARVQPKDDAESNSRPPKTQNSAAVLRFTRGKRESSILANHMNPKFGGDIPYTTTIPMKVLSTNKRLFRVHLVLKDLEHSERQASV